MTKEDSTVNVRLYKRLPIYVMLGMVNRWLASPRGNWKSHTVFIRTEMLLFSDISCAADWFSEWQIAKCMIIWYCRGGMIANRGSFDPDGTKWCVVNRTRLHTSSLYVGDNMLIACNCDGMTHSLSRAIKIRRCQSQPTRPTPFSQLLATQVVTPVPWSMRQ
jgi:hypothetical protein